ncbi:MAG TPA: methyltransferase domain-containing protein [Vicinamibacterales bacterium]|nr:methyltransferase domain-containing protein [Vicinamibacterales bacterium]
MEPERLADRLARLERERADADREYNERLTGVDQSLLKRPEFPHPPPPYDEAQVTPLNQAWNILPDGEPTIDGSLKGRLRGFIWRLIGPPLTTQKAFNAALVDHVNRNVAAHREAERAIATTIALIRQQTEAHVQFQSALIRHLQSLTLYVDTRDRRIGGQAEVVNAAISALSDDWLKHWESMLAREARFESRNPALLQAYEELKEKVTLAQQSALLLKRQVEQLIGEGLRVTTVPGTPDPPVVGVPDLDAFKYVGFEDRFRGSQHEIRERLTDYLPVFAGASHVLDIGCGRGELLDLFRGAGIGAHGIDTNQSMVQECRDRGLTADCDDAVAYLQRLPDESLDGVIAIQVVEHLEPAYLTRLIELAFHKLKPQAPMVLETLNPACWVAFFESYLRDVTHRWPLHPDTLQYLVQASGFSSVKIQYRAPVPETDRLQQVPRPVSSAGMDVNPTVIDLVDVVNAHADKLNARLFTFMDYAVVARR